MPISPGPQIPATIAAQPDRVADIVARSLSLHGIRHAFGMPGGEVVTLIDALALAGVDFHLARHETAAALMAAGCSVLTGAPGLLVTTVGPGLTNAINGIADAAQEHVPLLVISGVVDRGMRARYTHQVIDHAAILRPLVKASFDIEAGSAGATVARALALALRHPQGPVHLDLAPAMAAQPAIEAPWGPVPETRATLRADDPALAPLLARLAGAARPVILAGWQAAQAGADMAALAEALQAPVLTTYKAKGGLDETHPLALGGAGLSPKADRILLDLLAGADLVLALGYDPIEMRPGWMDPVPADRLIEITAAPADHAMHRAGQRLLACPAQAAAALVAALPVAAARDWWHPARTALDAAFHKPKDWGPHAIIRTLAAHAGPDTVVTVDSGAHRILLSQIWQARRPARLLQSAGFCTMAAALPLAIGAAVARPGHRTIAVMGDGGFEMCAGEMATLRDLNLPVTVVVFQDDSLALIAQKQAQAGLSPRATALGRSDLATVARGFGAHGDSVTDAPALARALDDAAARPGATLITCRFDADDYHDAF
ncbi:thiamine pyrophosphate-binding protein [Paracoccus nototheniae]|uniref:Thiamine pyrophosphate-binding protein n=2 Tax=Paracoccus nototheniae TaxID=2489002 RepID=A0ABW4E0M9_9RHOB|nr:thiamine pyrophosphate-binding protein [Paracoccus nototheniae]